MQKLKTQSTDISQENIERIKELFPNCVTEVKDEKGSLLRHEIDFDILRQDLSDHIVEGPKERYSFNWPGKRGSILLANAPTTNVLRPMPERSVNFFDTKNVYIEGDNLEALKILRETYLGKIKMIYIDPPYNTGNDFVYRDDFKESTEEYLKDSGNIDDFGNRLASNNESSGRFHSNWLNMLYPRLLIARDLLSDDGVIFISIDDNEVANLRKLCDEFLGAENFIAEFPRVTKRGGKSTETYSKNHDYVLCFCKNINFVKIRGVAHVDEGFKFQDEYFDKRGAYKLNQTLDYNTLQYNTSMDYVIDIDGQQYVPGGDMELFKRRHEGIHANHDWVWRWSKDLFEFGYKNGWVVISKSGRIYTKTYLNARISKKPSGDYFIEYSERAKALSTLEFVDNSYSNDNSNKEITKLMGSPLFEYVKPTSLVRRLAETATDQDSIILDFFSGSATTAHAIMQLNAQDDGNRKFIMVQFPEKTPETSEAYKSGYKTICDIGEERLRRAGALIKEENQLSSTSFDTGFRVYKVDSNNLKNTMVKPEDVQLSFLDDENSAIKSDRTSLDLLTQVMLQLGITLDADIKKGMLKDGAEYFAVNDNDLICCFSKNITESEMEELAKMQPANVAFRDDSFASDQDSVNCEQIFATLSPRTGKNIFVF